MCDAVCFTLTAVYLTEVKATHAKKYAYKDTKDLIVTAEKVNVKALLAVYFKSTHSSQGKGRWVYKILDNKQMAVRKDDRPDNI